MKWICFLLLLGCAQVTSLNLKRHQFGTLPTKIIWFQVAGLEEEHLAMLRFQYSGERITAFEENICLGKTWNYNLYDLRSQAQSSFLSQMTGKKNVKLNCEDAELRPIWNYLSGNGYSTGILEAGATSKESLVSFNQCGEKGLVFLSSLYFWLRQTPEPDAETFHYAEMIPMKTNQFMYDRTCTKGKCSSSIYDDMRGIYTYFRKTSQKHLMIIRDFSYLHALEKKNFLEARDILADLERALAEALNFSKQSSDYLILLTTGDSRLVDMPDQGRAWYEFEKNGSNIQMKRTRLTNLVFASGSRAENFCGFYGDAHVFERILSGPKQQGLELKIINPFR